MRAQQVGGRALEPHLALLQEHRPIGQPQRGAHRLLHQHDRRPVGVDRADDLEQRLDDRRRQPERQLVDHQQLRPGDERLGQAQHLLLAARQAAGRRVEPVGQRREVLEHPRRRRRARTRRRWRYSHDAARRFSVDGQAGEHAAPAGYLRDAQRGDRVRIAPGDVVAVEEDAAALRRHETRDRLQHRGLPGAVGAEEGDDLALGHVEVRPRRAPASGRTRRRGRGHAAAAPDQRRPRRPPSRRQRATPTRLSVSSATNLAAVAEDEATDHPVGPEGEHTPPDALVVRQRAHTGAVEQDGHAEDEEQRAETERQRAGPRRRHHRLDRVEGGWKTPIT